MEQQTARKSVCFLTHELITGGIEKVLAEALNVLHEQYDVEVVSLFDGAERSVIDTFPPNVTVKVGPFCKNKLFDRVKYRLYLCKFYFNKSLTRKYDYIVSLKHLERGACFSNRGKHYIYWCHNDSHTRFLAQNISKTVAKQKRRTKKLFKKHDMIWTVNDIIADELREIFPFDNFYALPNPIDCKTVLEKTRSPVTWCLIKTKPTLCYWEEYLPKKVSTGSLNSCTNMSSKNSRTYIFTS